MMGRALALARLNHGLTGPNPSVGCVILDSHGHIVGEGVTGRGGRPHAEEIALEEAGEAARGGTAYVTLEPCRERTNGEAACSKRLIEAGVSKVVIAVMDKHPKGAGGKAAIEAAGITVVPGFLEADAAPLYEDFFASLA